MGNTRTVTSRELVEQRDIQFIRSQTLELTLIEARPRSRMYVFFDNEDVTYLCNNKGNERGSPIFTDQVGQAEIEFKIPSGEFNIGTYEITVTDANDIDLLETDRSFYGSARAEFSASGELQIFQPTETKIIEVSRSDPSNRDPLAQSFFTFGIESGIFVSSIEVFFSTKDPEETVRCEIRPLENGYPAKLDQSSAIKISTLDPSLVTTSDDASVPTKFEFDPPVYLSGDAEYCFVLRSNSNQYNVYTSRMGELSIEDGRSISEQPYVGSLFKSENNVTWSAFQFEDIKFRINKARFEDGTTGVLKMRSDLRSSKAFGDQIFTTSGSNTVRYEHPVRHGLEVGDNIHFKTYTGANFTNADMNGIPYTEFNGTHTVTSVPDENSVTFDLTSSATSDGNISSAGVVTHIAVIAGGSGYVDGESVIITGGGGADATGVIRTANGTITGVTITDSGTGYTSNPSVSVNSASGSGADLFASITPPLNVYVNKPMTGIRPNIAVYNYDDTKSVNYLEPIVGNFPGGNLNSYTSGDRIEFVPNDSYPNLDQNLLIASRYNEDEYLSGNSSGDITIELSTSNPNVSPVVDTKKPPRLEVSSYTINNQPNETRSATSGSASVDEIVVTSAGSDYSAVPSVVIDPPDLSDGTQATATATISGGSVTGITVDDAGSGYTSVPSVTLVNDPSDTSGTGAAAQATVTPFNSELLPTGGNARARYITKTTGLEVPSTGIRLFSVLSSVEGGYVDWYIRTSKSSAEVNHDDQNWQRLECDIERDQSDFYGQMLEYEFYLDNIPEFDVYDLKCVMGADDPIRSPIVKAYRVIITA